MAKGKDHYNEYLIGKSLVMKPEEILEIIKVQFTEEISKFPEELQAFVNQ